MSVNMEVYLDNSATTKISEGVRNIMLQTFDVDYGNPSSMHLIGMKAEDYIKQAASELATTMKVDAKEIIFTSGGTESNNLALVGIAKAYARRGKHIITTKIEHPSVSEPLNSLKEQGYEIDYLSVDECGKICLDELKSLMREDTILVSIMYVNNEIGAVQDVELISKEIKKINPEVLFHVDAIQAYGKYRIYPKRQGIDLLSISGHKIHGPKGSGALYVRKGVRLLPIIFGGGQQGGMRSGTENVPAIAGIGQAAKEIYADYDERIERLYQIKYEFIKQLLMIENARIHGFTQELLQNLTLDEVKKTAPHIVNVSFMGIRSEVMLHALEEKGVYISAGSACSSNHPKPSETLKAIGVEAKEIESAVRFSFQMETSMEEINYAIEVLQELVPMLRRFTRK